ncbi:MAG TPA: nucleoside-diphosphate sugar epimerase/dehydratase [Phycisphaerae bacterium]|nr:nucleoside-diphosphate sugar epimerase/dehydratase [Phycisphaerae bacterium]
MSDASSPALSVPRKGILRYRDALSWLIHILLFAVALFIAFGLYFNFRRFDEWFFPYYLRLIVPVVLIKTAVFWRMNLFRGTWRYVGMRDLGAITMGSHVSTFFFVVLFFTVAKIFPEFLDHPRFQFPQSVFLLDWGTTIGVVCGARLLVRLYHEEVRHVASSGSRQCLILGAGDTGEALLREILRMRVERYVVVGFLDDDAAKQSARIHGVPVLGRISEARAFCERYQIEELLLAMPSAPQKTLRKIVEQCAGMNVRFRTVPSMEALIEGKVAVSQVRDVNIKDLLGREQVELDQHKISEQIRGQRILVTGAGGSIGSELCRQICRFEPARLILVEQAENNLFDIDRELQDHFPGVSLVCYVADIIDAKRVDHIIASETPSVIFHAAAHKHVPMMEINVGEAIKNNVLGTKVVADAARRHGVTQFVMISTDKAVNPTSVMGCTKRVAEMYIQQLRQGGNTRFMTVRFGNVLGSSGSVIPIFQRQIAAGGPVTVTDANMTRYFMTIPEASQLVMQAGVMGHDGDIFVLDMGEPVKIVDLAREMITLSGLRPGDDIEIKFTGIRPGEKLYEELSVRGEDMGKTTHEKIYVWRNRKEDWARVCRLIGELIASADDAGPDGLRKRLVDLVPEYKPEALARKSSQDGPLKTRSTSPTDRESNAGLRALPLGDSPVG